MIILFFIIFAGNLYSSTITVSSNSASWDRTKEVLVLKGNVVLKRGPLTLKAPIVQLKGQIDKPEKIIASGGVFVLDKERNAKIKAETIEVFPLEKKAICKGDVSINYQGRIISAKSGYYEGIKNIAKLTGSCTLEEEGKYFEGDIIKYFLDEERIELEGSVKGSLLVK